MDGNDHKYYLYVNLQKYNSRNNLGSLTTFIKAAGGKNIYSNEKTFCAFLPDQTCVGEGYVRQILSEWGYVYTMKEIQTNKKNENQRRQEQQKYEKRKKEAQRKENVRLIRKAKLEWETMKVIQHKQKQEDNERYWKQRQDKEDEQFMNVFDSYDSD